MSEYNFPSGPGFPKIRWYVRPDGRFEAEWLVELIPATPSPLPLALTLTRGVEVTVRIPHDSAVSVRLVSDAKSIQPEVYSVFYQLIRPAFERGFISAIEGGDLDVHGYIIAGTVPP